MRALSVLGIWLLVVNQLQGFRTFMTMKLSRKSKSPVTVPFQNVGSLSITDPLKNLRIGIHNESLSLEELLVLISQDSLPSTRSSWAADCIWSMGSSGVLLQANDTSLLVVRHLLDRMRNNRALSGKDVSKTFVGLARMNALWSSSNLPTLTLEALLRWSVSDLQAQGVSNVLWSLGAMQADTTALPLDIQISFLSQLHKQSPGFTDQGVANSLWGLAKTSVKWRYLPMTVKSALCSAVCRLCSRMSGQSVANIIYSLGVMGVSRDSLTDRMHVAIEVSIRKSYERMSGKDVAQTLHGLSLIGFEWTQLTPRTRDCIAIAVFKQVNIWSSDPITALREISTVLYALRTMDTKWSKLPSGLRSGVLVALRSLCDFENRFDEKYLKRMYGASRAAHTTVSGGTSKRGYIHQDVTADGAVEDELRQVESSAQSVATIVYSLSRLKAEFSQIPEDSRASLLRCLEMLSPYLSAQGVTMAVYGLGRLGAEWHSVPHRLRSALEESLLRHRDDLAPLSLAQVMYGMGAMRARWADLQETMRYSFTYALQRTIGATEPQMLPMLLYGLAHMDIDFYTHLSPSLRDNIIRCFKHHRHLLSAQDLSICLQSFGSLKVSPSIVGDLSFACEAIANMGSASLVLSLQGLANIGAQWSSWSHAAQRSVLLAMSINQIDFLSVDVANIFYSLGKLEVSWLQLNGDSRDGLLQCLADSVDDMEPHHVAMVLSAFSSMRLPWSSLAIQYSELLLRRVVSIADTLDCHTLNTIFSSLTFMGCSEDLSIMKLVDRLQHLVSDLDSVEALRALSSLNRCQATQTLDLQTLLDLQKKLLSISEDIPTLETSRFTSGNINSLDILKRLELLSKEPSTSPEITPFVTTLVSMYCNDGASGSNWGQHSRFLRVLSALGIKWTELDKSTTSRLLALCQASVEADSRSVASRLDDELLARLLKLECRWSYLESGVRDAMMSKFFASAQIMNYPAETVLQLISGFQVAWSDLSSLSRRSAVSFVSSAVLREHSFDPNTISVSTNILVAMGACWENLPTRPRNSLSTDLAAISRNNMTIAVVVVRALSRLGAKWRMMTTELRDVIEKTAPDTACLMK